MGSVFFFFNQGFAQTPGQHHQSPSERFSTALYRYIHLLLDKSPIKLMLNERKHFENRD